jgi:hypothetical protein
MLLLPGLTAALLLVSSTSPMRSFQLDTLPVPSVPAAVTAITTDSAPGTPPPAGLAAPFTTALPATLLDGRPAGLTAIADTVPRKRAKAIVYSDAYGTRLTIHKTLSWAMLPLFAVSYVTGDQLIKKGSDAPDWARSIHPAAATSTAVLFGANTITGAWNLWDSRHDPNGRVRRYLHSVLFLAASGGFAYTGTKLANDAQQSYSKRQVHRNGAVVSMGVSTVSWLIMLVGR